MSVKNPTLRQGDLATRRTSGRFAPSPLRPIASTYLRVGRLSFINAWPYYADPQLETLPIRWHAGVPSELNHLLATAALDVSPVSSIEYARRAQDYLLLAPFALSSFGPSRSVFLVSRRPLADLGGATIGLTDQSASAAALLQILFARRFGLSARFEVSGLAPQSMRDRYDAFLVIGDAALQWAAQGGLASEGVLLYDLGILWAEWTQRPFTFLLWAVRRSVAEQEPGAVDALGRAIQAGLESDPVKERSWEADGERALSLAPGRLEGYFKGFSYIRSPQQEEGLHRFYDEAARLQLTTPCEEIRWFSSRTI